MTQKISATMRKWSLGIAAMFVLAIVPSAFAQNDVFTVNIPFAFQVGAKMLQAGAYDVRIEWGTEVVTVTGVKGGADTIGIFTTLAPAQHSTANDSHVVFDKVGTTYTLSEVWQPGYGGVLVHATKGKHEHEVIHVKKK